MLARRRHPEREALRALLEQRVFVSGRMGNQRRGEMFLVVELRVTVRIGEPQPLQLDHLWVYLPKQALLLPSGAVVRFVGWVSTYQRADGSQGVGIAPIRLIL